jgi:hypothetical protein
VPAGVAMLRRQRRRWLIATWVFALVFVLLRSGSRGVRARALLLASEDRRASLTRATTRWGINLAFPGDEGIPRCAARILNPASRSPPLLLKHTTYNIALSISKTREAHAGPCAAAGRTHSLARGGRERAYAHTRHSTGRPDTTTNKMVCAASNKGRPAHATGVQLREPSRRAAMVARTPDLALLACT